MTISNNRKAILSELAGEAVQSAPSVQVTEPDPIDDPAIPRDYKFIRKLLENHVCQVDFVKVDGTQRTIRGTLNPKWIPEKEETEEEKLKKANKPPRAANYKSMPIYDLDAAGWRAFRIDSTDIIQFENSVGIPLYYTPVDWNKL